MLLFELGHELFTEMGFAEFASLHVYNHVMYQIQQNYKKCVRRGWLQLHIEVSNSHFLIICHPNLPS